MSESEYRSAREAARARVVALESQLHQHDASATRTLDPSPSKYSEEKRELRDRLGRIAKGRNVFRLVIALMFASIARHSLVDGAATGVVATAVLATIFLTMIFRSKPRGEELKLEQRLREIIKSEDDDYARFRVQTSAGQARVDFEHKERARIESEIEEARMLADGEEKKS